MTANGNQILAKTVIWEQTDLEIWLKNHFFEWEFVILWIEHIVMCVWVKGNGQVMFQEFLNKHSHLLQWVEFCLWVFGKLESQPKLCFMCRALVDVGIVWAFLLSWVWKLVWNPQNWGSLFPGSKIQRFGLTYSFLYHKVRHLKSWVLSELFEHGRLHMLHPMVHQNWNKIRNINSVVYLIPLCVLFF